MGRNIAHDLLSVFRFDQCMRFRTLLLAAIAMWIFVLIRLILIATNTDTHNVESVSAYQSLEKTIVGLRHRVEEGSENLAKTVKWLDQIAGGKPQNESTINLSHELLRRRAIHFTREIHYAASGQLGLINKTLRQPDTLKTQSEVEKLLKTVDLLYGWLEEMTRYLEVDLEGLGQVNHMTESRRSELDRLGSRVRDRIDRLQNPTDCSKAKFLVVSLERPCAFGCNVHHLAYCLQLAYASGRTLVFSGTKTAYDTWWATNFLPLSKTCNDMDFSDSGSIPQFTGQDPTDPTRITKCGYIGSMNNFVKWLPPAIPKDLASELTRLHGAPFVWFIGHLTVYLMRPTLAFEQIINNTLTAHKLIGFNRTLTVGVHVRRTDKINSEAAFHPIDEYMLHVERRFRFWQSQQQMMSRTDEWVGDTHVKLQFQPSITRRVFIATDEPSVFEDARNRYPQYVIEGDPDRARSADLRSRTQSDSITGIALDIIMLSRTDFLVCTFSSQVCRVAYELMQTRHAELGDASGLVQSLDDIYYFGGQQASPYETIIADTSAGAKPGDLFHMAGNHWDGYAKVHSVVNGPQVLVPAYKFRPRVLSADMGENVPV
ncbi:Alpha 1 6 fucosyltransferase H [Paragonimus skrjabini miyazakii]|uniref:Alpha 1 6 fucosyltransferase H n=1 Tax=Paragonimus skrjabini miyazakii TaxID=59628 RepID=A0A8S9YCH8_9TREM|nr:Alpha 1 6 fucosyltransferase H [Paragonimus skrjabini miyazakii]